MISVSKMTETEKYASTDAERWRIHDIHEFGLDTRHFVIYLQGIEENPYDDLDEPGVEYRMANRFIKNLDILQGIDAEKPITVSMKTNGGDWVEGMAMHDAMLAVPNPITILNYTHARSMSSLMFQAANKRIMMKHSTFMFHEGTFGVNGTWKQVKNEVRFAKETDIQMMNVYIDAIKRTAHSSMHHWSRKKILKWLKDEMDKTEEVYMLPDATIAAGFADGMWVDDEDVTTYTEEQLAR